MERGNIPSVEDRPARGSPRASHDARIWIALMLSLATTLLALGATYGQLRGRLDLIEYRLLRIEQRLPLDPLRP